MTDAFYDDDNTLDEFSPDKDLKLGVWSQLARYALCYPQDLIMLALCAVLVGICEITFPLVTRWVIDDIGSLGAAIDLVFYSGLYGLLCLGLGVGVVGFLWFGGKLRSHMSHDIRRDGFENLQRLSFSYYDQRPVGWLMARMTSDCERLSNIMAWGILDLVWSFTIMLGISGAMLVMEPRLGFIILLSLPALAYISRYFQTRILKSAREVRQTNSRITGAYNENIMGVLTSKVFVKEADNLDKFGKITDRMHGASIQNAVQAAIYLPIVLTLSALATGIALVIGGIESAWGIITTGTLIAFLTYTRHFFEPIEQLAHWFAEMQMAQASAERVMSLIQAESEIRDSEQVEAQIAAHTGSSSLAADGYEQTIDSITFDRVGFSYENGPPILRDINLVLKRGQSVAVVGATGGGKTTLISLLARFYEPTEGSIRINDIDYRNRSLHYLQSNLGVVLQSSHLFKGTISDNIRYGRLDATIDEIHAAALKAGAHPVITEMPEAYDTQISEGGASLSAGQKQLISFARALLADPQILIMDEATSSVDTLTEARIEQGLRVLLQDRISVIIAHRLSTIRHADVILVMEHGQIIEQGNHEALIQLKGRYHHLYQQQSLNNLWGETAPEVDAT